MKGFDSVVALMLFTHFQQQQGRGYEGLKGDILDGDRMGSFFYFG